MSSKIFKYILSFTGDTKGVTSAINSIQLKLKDVAAAVGAAFSVSAVVAFSKASVEAYDSSIKAETALLTALKGQVGVQQRLIDQAGELMRVTLYDDDEIVRAQSLVAAFVKEESQIKALIPLIQDFATAKDMDLASAADLVTKTLAGEMNALGRYGIQIEGAAGSTERFELIQQSLNDAFGGQAEAAAKVGTAAIQQLSNEYGNLQEVIGKLIISQQNQEGSFTKILTSATRGVTNFLGKVATWSEAGLGLVQSIMGAIWGSDEDTSKVATMMAEYNAELEKNAQKAGQVSNEQKNQSEITLTLDQIQQKSIKTYADLGERIGEYNKLLDTADITNTSYIRTVYAEITALEAKKKAFEDLAKPLVVREAVPAALPTISATQVEWRKIPATATDDTNALTNANYELIDSYNQIAYAAGAAFDTMGNKIVEGLGLAEDGFEGFLGGMIQTVAKLIGMAMSNAVANAIVGGTQAAVATGPAAPFTMPAFIATAVGGVIAAFAAIPKFADGGIVSGPTIGMMGEYPGASTNPEVIAPLSKLQGMLQPVGSSMIILQPSIEYSGDRFRVFLNKTESKVAKRNGYRRF